MTPSPLRPDRLFRLEKPFVAIPCRLLQGGFLSRLSAEGTQLYLMLCLAADRRGLSFWGLDRIADELQMSPDALVHAFDGLQAVDLLATNGRCHQVLSLPPPPPSPPPSPQAVTTVQAPRRATQPDVSEDMPRDVRHRLDQLFRHR
jgi:hypothetical protein